MKIIIDIAASAAMIGLIVSGVMLSVHVFAFLNISGGAMFARQLHIAASHWAFLIFALHLGIHWSVFLGLFRRLFKIKRPSNAR